MSISHSTSELAHGRVETRSIKIAQLAPGELDFPGVRAIVVIDKTIENKKIGNIYKEQIPYITSLLNPPLETALTISRLHWSVENKLHYKKDVAFNEDQQTLHSENSSINMSALRALQVQENKSHLAE